VTASIHPEARFELPERLPTPARVLTIGAHHDDAEFGCGGTLAKWAEDGAEISMLPTTALPGLGTTAARVTSNEPSYCSAARLPPGGESGGAAASG